MTTFQQLHQTAPETKGRGDCYYANLKESSLTWTIMLVLSRIELTPSIIKAPNLPWRISILLFFSAIFLLHTIINNKKEKINQTFSPVWVTFHAALKVVACLLNWNDYRFFHPWPRRELWGPIQALRERKAVRQRLLGHHSTKHFPTM